MSATEVIEELKQMPADDRARVVDWLVEQDDDAFFAWADSLPLNVEMTEEKILALPRMIPADACPPR